MKEDVIRRITQNIRNQKLKDRLIQKVTIGEDLTLEESKLIYGPVEFGEELLMTKNRPLDIDWTDHAEYRGELRDINPKRMNEEVKEKVKSRFLKKPKSKGKETFKGDAGIAVVDFDTSDVPAEANIVTTWASLQENRKPINILKFSSIHEALQYLSDYTKQKIKIARGGFYSLFKPLAGLKTSEQIDQEWEKTYEKLGAYKMNYEILYDEYMKTIEKAQDIEKELSDLEDRYLR